MRLTIGETEFVLRPNYREFAQIIEAAGCGLVTVLKRLEDGDITAATAILWGASGTEMKRDEIGALILEHGGISGLLSSGELTVFMLRGISGNDRVEKALAEQKKKSEPKKEDAADAGDTKSGPGLLALDGAA